MIKYLLTSTPLFSLNISWNNWFFKKLGLSSHFAFSFYISQGKAIHRHFYIVISLIFEQPLEFRQTFPKSIFKRSVIWSIDTFEIDTPLIVITQKRVGNTFKVWGDISLT